MIRVVRSVTLSRSSATSKLKSLSSLNWIGTGLAPAKLMTDS